MLLRATNIGKAKLINLWVVFDSIRLHGPLSRADIARRTGLSKQAVSNLVDELFAAGLLRPEERRPLGVGKPPLHLSINPEGGFMVGLQLDRGRLVALVADIAGHVRARDSSVLPPNGPERAPDHLAEAVGRVVAAAAIDRSQLLGVGLVMPGPFAVDGLGPTSLPGWEGPRIAAALEATVGLPVLLENDATAAASAEWLFGAGRGLHSFVYLFVGIGLGGGLILDGRPYGGAGGNAGEFGHLVVRPDGRPCGCGNRGCLETYVSLDALFRWLGEAGGGTGAAPSSVDDFEAAVAPGDPRVDAWLDQADGPFRTGINTVENVFDPETIVLGGDAPAWLLGALSERCLPLMPSIRSRRDGSSPRLRIATSGRDAAALGGAVLPILNRLNPGFRAAPSRAEAVPARQVQTA